MGLESMQTVNRYVITNIIHSVLPTYWNVRCRVPLRAPLTLSGSGWKIFYALRQSRAKLKFFEIFKFVDKSGNVQNRPGLLQLYREKK